MSTYFIKRPVVVEAFQLTAERMASNVDWPNWLHEAWNLKRNMVGSLSPAPHRSTGFMVGTINGPVYVAPGEWIIKGVHGELYPCDPEIFEKTYEPHIVGVDPGSEKGDFTP